MRLCASTSLESPDSCSVGRRHVLVSGIALFAVASLGFIGDSVSIPLLALLFVLVGASTALVETGQGAYAADLLHDSIRGRGFGFLGLVDGIGDLVPSIVVGILFTVTDPTWGFVYAAALSTVGALVLARRGSKASSAKRELMTVSCDENASDRSRSNAPSNRNGSSSGSNPGSSPRNHEGWRASSESAWHRRDRAEPVREKSAGRRETMIIGG